jgi:hypothetical protein
MHTAPLSGSWGLHWARSARDVPQGRLLAGFLIDLVADTSRMREANSVCFPRDLAAHALGVEPARLVAALRSLAKARLLTWRLEGAPDDPDVAVTLLLSSLDRSTIADVQTDSVGSSPVRPVRPAGSTRAAVQGAHS